MVIGGANGSGKTTVAKEYISSKNFPYLGADQIAAELNANDVESVAIEAGRIFIQKIDEFIEKRESFIVESTLSGLSLRKWIKKAAETGYFVSVSFVYLDSPQLCINRVRERVIKGGHHVPAEDIIRRYDRSNKNFWSVYAPLANEWKLFSNVAFKISAVATGERESVIILDEEKFEIWLEMVTDKPTEK